MDSITSSALEEICAAGSSGIPIAALWLKLRPALAAAGLDLCDGVKASLWSSLLAVPSLRFTSPADVRHGGGDPAVQRLEEAERSDLCIVAEEGLRNSFVGLHDLRAVDAGISQNQKQALELLGAARTNGITQTQLAREFCKKGNNMFFIVRNLESQGLVTRHSTIVRMKDAHSERESSHSSTTPTNMIYLSRYSKRLGPQQKLEITKDDNRLNNIGNADQNAVTGDNAAGACMEEEVLVKDNLPAMKAICEKLEAAKGKILVMSDIKKDLGYQNHAGHKPWRTICTKLKDAGIVEEFLAEVNKKEARCLRLLKKLSPTIFEQRTVVFGDDRHKITDQLVELPIEHRIHDIISAAGPEGLRTTDVCRRLGINHKKTYRWLLNMVRKFGMLIQPENCNKGKVYRVCISGEANYRATEVDPSHGHLADGEYVHMLLPPSDPLEVVDEHRDPVPDARLDLVKVANEQNCGLLETSPPATSKQLKPQSYPMYPCLTLTAVTAQRQQRVLELLQEKKFILRAELHRWLESFEQDKHTAMDRRTLFRIFDNLQKLGLCRCINVSIPAATNYRRSRTTQVILHPSIQGLPPELLGQIHDRMRSFDMQVRREGLSRLKDKLSIPVLHDVQRISNHVHSDHKAAKSESMRANGFVIAKMSRAKLLHSFLWDYLNSSPCTDDAISSGYHGCDLKNLHRTRKLFVLDAAIKAIPLELFLQVVGSSQQFDDMIEKCKSGLRLYDLPVHDYKRLMDTHATGRLSWIIDILRRLKLIRVITNGNSDGGSSAPVATLTHAMELKPYIEEPLSIVAPYKKFISVDLRPRRRHDFILSNREAVDLYWKTLEYCYVAADPAAALHAFPGSTVHEVFRKRSWTSVRIMTAEQRSELLKRIVNGDPSKKLSFLECENIAQDLSLTFEQVLHFYYMKRQQHLRRFQKGSNARREEFQPRENYHLLSPGKRKRSLERKPLKLVEAGSEAVRLVERDVGRSSKICGETEEENFNRTFSGALDSNLQSYREDYHLEDEEEPGSLEEDEKHHSFSSQCDFSWMKPPRQKKFSWTEEADRKLIIQYVRHRAALGAKFHRVDWGSLTDLPAPQSCCRRRIQLLNSNMKFRKSIMRLCNMLSKRYSKHLVNARRHQSDSRPKIEGKVQNRNSSDSVEHTEDSDFMEELWDNFEDENIKVALDEALRHKKIAKLDASKRNGSVTEKWSDLNRDDEDLHRPQLVSSGTPSEVSRNHDIECNGSSKRLKRRRLPPMFIGLSNKRNNVDRQAYESLAVSNAIELLKLVFLDTSTAPEVQNLLAETLRRYSEHDLFTAFNYLREKKLMVGVEGRNSSVLSPHFLQNVSSPFPTGTGKRAAKFASWLHEREQGMMEEGVTLDADLQCGDIFHLFSLVSTGELSVMPCLPDEGFGDAEESRNIKRKADNNEIFNDDLTKRLKSSLAIEGEMTSRKEKGFPGIKVSLSRQRISTINAVEIFRHGNTSVGSLPIGETNPWYTTQKSRCDASHSDLMNENPNCESTVHEIGAPGESLWEAMTGYAKYLTSTHTDEEQVSPFCPELFRTVFAAIQRAGDQGLCMEEVSQVLGILGEERSEIIVEVLEAFGHAFKVNAYDSLHVVDALYQSKYFLAPMASYSQDHNSAPSMRIPDGHSTPWSDNNLYGNLNMKVDDVHRVTILNQPEEEVQLLNDTLCNDEVEGCMQGKVTKAFEFSSTDSHMFRPILPWINGDGTTKTVFFEVLVHRVFGIVMQNPGILEDDIIQRMDVLNPQSCRKLLELMILDNFVIVRKMHQTSSGSPPSILASLLGNSFNKSRSVFRKHFFANPNYACLL